MNGEFLGLPLEIEYQEDGGYDCMTPAFLVRSGGDELFCVDVKNFLPGSVHRKSVKFIDVLAHTKKVAQFVVHAVNRHDVLVEALNAAMTELEAISKHTGVSIEEFECWQKCQEAIAGEEDDGT